MACCRKIFYCTVYGNCCDGHSEISALDVAHSTCRLILNVTMWKKMQKILKHLYYMQQMIFHAF
jgi:hypothetical protein